MTDRALHIVSPRYRSYKNDGTVNSSGYVYFYDADLVTLTPKDTYRDAEMTALNTNPVVLNNRGEASVYGRGAYKIIETDSDGNQLSDAVGSVLLPNIDDKALALLKDVTPAQMRATLRLGSSAILDVGTSANN